MRVSGGSAQRTARDRRHRDCPGPDQRNNLPRDGMRRVGKPDADRLALPSAVMGRPQLAPDRHCTKGTVGDHPQRRQRRQGEQHNQHRSVHGKDLLSCCAHICGQTVHWCGKLRIVQSVPAFFRVLFLFPTSQAQIRCAGGGTSQSRGARLKRARLPDDSAEKSTWDALTYRWRMRVIRRASSIPEAEPERNYLWRPRPSPCSN